MENGSQIHMDNMVAKSHAIVAMRGNALVMIGMKTSVKVTSSFLERKIVKEIGLFLMVENMVVGNLVVFVINGLTNKKLFNITEIMFQIFIQITGHDEYHQSYINSNNISSLVLCLTTILYKKVSL